MIGKRLREARGRLQLSQEKLAADLGVARSTITGIETAHRPVGRQTLMDLANYFSVPVDYFTAKDELLATAMWILARMPHEELKNWVGALQGRAFGEKLPPID